MVFLSNYLVFKIVLAALGRVDYPVAGDLELKYDTANKIYLSGGSLDYVDDVTLYTTIGGETTNYELNLGIIQNKTTTTAYEVVLPSSSGHGTFGTNQDATRYVHQYPVSGGYNNGKFQVYSGTPSSGYTEYGSEIQPFNGDEPLFCSMSADGKYILVSTYNGGNDGYKMYKDNGSSYAYHSAYSHIGSHTSTGYTPAFVPSNNNFVITGTDNNSTWHFKLYVYNSSTETWTAKAQVTPSGSSTADVQRGLFSKGFTYDGNYFFMGCNGSTTRGEVWSVDWNANTMTYKWHTTEGNNGDGAGGAISPDNRYVVLCRHDGNPYRVYENTSGDWSTVVNVTSDFDLTGSGTSTTFGSYGVGFSGYSSKNTTPLYIGQFAGYYGDGKFRLENWSKRSPYQIYITDAGKYSIDATIAGLNYKTNELDITSVTIPAKVVQVSSGGNVSLALTEDGFVYAWGEDTYGQMGQGTTDTNVNTPVKVKGVGGSGFLSNITKITVGGVCCMALASDGTLYAWGRNTHNQLGDGTNTERKTPVKVSYSGDPISNIAAGMYHSAFTTTTGKVYAFGRNNQGQVGDNTSGTNRSTPTQVVGVGNSGTLTGIRDVSCGDDFTLAIKDSDGSAYGWGKQLYGMIGNGQNSGDAITPTPVILASDSSAVTGVTQISCGGDSTLMLKSDGTVYACGYNGLGQIGNGTTSDADSGLVQVLGVGGSGNLTDITQIAIATASSLALKSDGTMYSWGNNYDGQNGLGTVGGTNPSTPVAITLLTGVDTINNTSGKPSHFIVTKPDGSVFCWGRGDEGQIGDGTNTANQGTPTQVLAGAGPSIDGKFNLFTKPRLTFDGYNKFSLLHGLSSVSSKLFLGSNVYDIGTLTSDLTIETPGLYRGLVFDTGSNVAYFNKTTVGSITEPTITSTHRFKLEDGTITDENDNSQTFSSGGTFEAGVLRNDGKTSLKVTPGINKNFTLPSALSDWCVSMWVFIPYITSYGSSNSNDIPSDFSSYTTTFGWNWHAIFTYHMSNSKEFQMKTHYNWILNERADGSTSTGTANFEWYINSSIGASSRQSIHPGNNSNNSVWPEAWHHMALEYNGTTGNLTFYIDGNASSTTGTFSTGCSLSGFTLGDNTVYNAQTHNGSSTGSPYPFLYFSDIVIAPSWNIDTYNLTKGTYKHFLPIPNPLGVRQLRGEGNETSLTSDFISFDTYNKLSLSGITNPTSKIHALPTGAESTTTYDIGTATNMYIESAGTYTAEMKGSSAFALDSNVVSGTISFPSRTSYRYLALAFSRNNYENSIRTMTIEFDDGTKFDNANPPASSAFTENYAGSLATTDIFNSSTNTNYNGNSLGWSDGTWYCPFHIDCGSGFTKKVKRVTIINGQSDYQYSLIVPRLYGASSVPSTPGLAANWNYVCHVESIQRGWTSEISSYDMEPTAYRYIGLVGYRTVYAMHIYEFSIELVDGTVYDGSNIPTVSSNMTINSGSAANTIDGDFTNKANWNSASTYTSASQQYVYLKVDLGSAKKVKHVRVWSNYTGTYTNGPNSMNYYGSSTNTSSVNAEGSSDWNRLGPIEMLKSNDTTEQTINSSLYDSKLEFDGYNKLSLNKFDPTSSTLKYGSNTYDLGTITNVYIANAGTYSAEIKGATNFALSSNVTGGTITPYKTIVKTQDLLGTVASEHFGMTDYEGTGSLAFSKDGTRLAVGAYNYNSMAGRVYIYTLSGGTYSLDSGMPLEGGSGQHMGYAINLNDDGTKIGLGSGNGLSGRVYERSASGSWSLRGSSFGSGTYWTKGIVIDASGDRALGGAPGDNTLKLFDWNGSAYTETTTFSGSGDFGNSFDMTRDGLTVLGINKQTGNTVKVWNYSSGSWTQVGSDISVGDVTSLVHMARGTGTRFVVSNHTNNSSTGFVKLFEYSSGSWSEIKEWTGYTSGVQFGWDHSISDDGTIIIAGSTNDDTGSSGNNAGMISIFTEKNGTWEEKRFLGDTDSMHLGMGVTMSYDGSFYAAAAPYDGESFSNAGKVRIYQNKKVFDFDGYNKLTFSGLESGSTSNVTFDGNTYSIGTASNVYIENTGTYEAESKGTTTFALTSNVVGAGQISLPPVYPSVSVAPTVVTPINFTSGSWAGSHYFVYRGDVVQNGITHYHWNLDFQSGNTPVNYSVLYDYVNRIWKDGDGSTPFYMSPSTPLVGTNLSVTNPVNVHGYDTNQTSEYFGFPNPYYQAPNYTPSLTHDGYKLIVKNITPTSTTLKYGSNTYEIGSATNIYVKDTGAYTAEIGNAADFALTSNTVSGTIKTIEPVINGGYFFGHALTYDGKLYGWGENSDGELGVGDNSDKGVPTLCTGIPQGEVVSIWNQAKRGESRWAKTRDGRIWVTGNHASYCLPGSSANFTTFTDVSAQFGDYTQTATSVVWASGSERATQVLMENGDVWSFGNDGGAAGILGQGASPTSDRTPRKLTGISNVTKIVYNGDLVLALDSSNVVWMWGSNSIGHGSPNWGAYNVPTNIMGTGTANLTGLLVSGETVTDIECGSYSMFVITSKGTVYATGKNGSGQLGQGGTTAKSSSDGWVKIEYFTSNAITVNKLYTGNQNPHVFADTSDGWYCWGENGVGQLGLGDTTDKLSPVKFTSVSNIKKFGEGDIVSYAITEDGKYYAWGLGGSNNPRGDNTTGNISYPKYIDTLPNILAPSFDFDGYDKVFVNKPYTQGQIVKFSKTTQTWSKQIIITDVRIKDKNGNILPIEYIYFPFSNGGPGNDLEYIRPSDSLFSTFTDGSYSSVDSGALRNNPQTNRLIHAPDATYNTYPIGTEWMHVKAASGSIAQVQIVWDRQMYIQPTKLDADGMTYDIPQGNQGTNAGQDTTYTLTGSYTSEKTSKYTKGTTTYDVGKASIITVPDPGTYDAQIKDLENFNLKSATVPATKASGLYTWAFHHGNFDNAYGDGDILTARDNGRFYADTPTFTGDIGTITPAGTSSSFVYEFFISVLVGSSGSNNELWLQEISSTGFSLTASMMVMNTQYKVNGTDYNAGTSVVSGLFDGSTGQTNRVGVYPGYHDLNQKIFTLTTSQELTNIVIASQRPIYAPGWKIVLNGTTIVEDSANGGSSSTPDPFIITKTFPVNSNTTYTFAPPSGGLTANVLMVAGGGGGGGRYSCGGGGAGGLVYTAGTSLANGATKTIVVGNGDSGGNGGSQNGYTGKDTTFTGLDNALGGGYGGTQGNAGGTGGSGGGGGGQTANGTGGSATSGQGFAGGTGSNSGSHGGAGGGGAGAVGGNGSNGVGGNGGIGKFFGTESSFTNFGDEYGEGGYFAGGAGGGTSGGYDLGIPGRGGGGYGQGYDGYMGRGGSQHGMVHTGGGGGGGGTPDRDQHPGYASNGDGGVTAHGGRGGSGIVLLQTNVAPPNGVNTAVVQVGNPRRRSPFYTNAMGSEVNRFYIIDGASMPTYKLPTHWYADPNSSNSTNVPVSQGSHSLQKRADGGTSNVWYQTSSNYFADYGTKMAQSADAIFMPVEQQRYDVLLSIGQNTTHDIQLEMAADGTAALYYDNGATLLSAGTITCFTVGKWHHIALTVDSEHNAVGYVNGHPVVSTTYTSHYDVGSRDGNMHMRVGVNATFRKFLVYEVSTYNFHMSPKQVLQRAAEVGLGPKLEYDGLNTIKILNTEPGSSVKLFTSNVADTSNVFIVADPAAGEYTVPEAGKYYAEIKGTDTFTVTKTIDVSGTFPLYQYPPYDGTTSSLTQSASADTWNTWTISGASNGNGQYQAKTTHAPHSSSFTVYRAFNNDVSDDNGQYVDASQKTNVGLTLQLPSAKTIRKYRMYPVDHSLSSGAIPGSSTDPTLSGGDPDYKSRPKSWILKGSSDGTNWTDLDTVTNKPISIYGDVYSIDSPASYQYYQMFVVNIVDTSALLRIGEWQLWGDA